MINAHAHAGDSLNCDIVLFLLLMEFRVKTADLHSAFFLSLRDIASAPVNIRAELRNNDQVFAATYQQLRNTSVM